MIKKRRKKHKCDNKRTKKPYFYLHNAEFTLGITIITVQYDWITKDQRKRYLKDVSVLKIGK